MKTIAFVSVKGTLTIEPALLVTHTLISRSVEIATVEVVLFQLFVHLFESIDQDFFSFTVCFFVYYLFSLNVK